ncbi:MULTISPECIES: 3-hydroxyacyl-CoA dehydrogenase family protein [Sphingobacterium]|uniref:3-hydroxyacyl-CoA dehydrogenase family protein n=1 Tax=Sphingobacterium TaxID=28453 RepID=UPI002FDC9EE5
MAVQGIDNGQVGVVGLGLMGTSIALSLMLSGYKVIGIGLLEGEIEKAKHDLNMLLANAHQDYYRSGQQPDLEEMLLLTADFRALEECFFVQECVIEDLEIKKSIYTKIEAVVKESCTIASNTSAIPISQLQQFVKNPANFLGIHWAEPAYATRFLEITCGEKTDMDRADLMYAIAHHWGKEPTLLKKDIRGFITNRLMYAVYREALGLVNDGFTTFEQADELFKHDFGAWITFMGIFRRMDYLGTQHVLATLHKGFQDLYVYENVPPIMEEAVQRHKRGIHNLDGLYPYTKESAKQWAHLFEQFNLAIFRLSKKDSFNLNHSE